MKELHIEAVKKIAACQRAHGTDNSALRPTFSWIDKRDCAHMLVSKQPYQYQASTSCVEEKDDWSGSSMEGGLNLDVAR